MLASGVIKSQAETDVAVRVRSSVIEVQIESAVVSAVVPIPAVPKLSP